MATVTVAAGQAPRFSVAARPRSGRARVATAAHVPPARPHSPVTGTGREDSERDSEPGRETGREDSDSEPGRETTRSCASDSDAGYSEPSSPGRIAGRVSAGRETGRR